MANKSFVVQYLIRARENFSQAAESASISVDKLKNKIAAARKAIADSAKKIQKAGRNMAIGVTLPLALIGRSLINAASDADETKSKFQTVFKSVSAESADMAKNLAKNYGLGRTESMKLLGDTGDLLTGFGFSGKAALGLSNKVQELAVDLASFTNYSGGAAGASAALTKALLGERESLKSLGISISEKAVQQELMANLDKYSALGSMQQAKAEATLAIAIRQSTNAVGDYARTKAGYANVVRRTSASLQNMKETFGAILLPVATKVMGVIGGLMDKLDSISPRAKKIVVIIAAIAAALGPLLFLFGSLMLMWPVLVAGVATFGAVAAASLGPLTIIIGAIALGAYLIKRYWHELSTFFEGFAVGFNDSIGGSVGRVTDNFREAAKVIAQLFGKDSDATRTLHEFGNVGELIGNIVGTVIKKLLNGLSGIGEALGQLIGAVVNLDFSQFDVEAIKAQFEGRDNQYPGATNKMDVGISVGLDKGLKQMGGAIVNGFPVRPDLGTYNP